jgi:hypothetical protein
MLSSRLRLGLPKGFFHVGLPVKILKALLLSSILATCPAHFKLLDLITLSVQVVLVIENLALDCTLMVVDPNFKIRNF